MAYASQFYGSVERIWRERAVNLMTIRKFAEKHRLKITRDECGDEIIQGRRGHLYFDCGELCLMVTDGKRAKRSQWEALDGGLLWLGDITQGVQDVSIKGIPLDNAKLAIRLCQIKRKRLMSEAQKAHAESALAKAHKIRQTSRQSTSHALESLAARPVKELGGPGK